MVQALRMPMMGNTMEVGLLAEWRVDEGDTIEEGDVIAIVESEKASADIVADQGGILNRVDVFEGEEVPPGTIIGIIAGPDEDANNVPAPRSRIDPEGQSDVEPSKLESAEVEDSREETSLGDHEEEKSEIVRATPGARKLASEHNVDLAMIDGTGSDGTVRKVDVEKWTNKTAQTSKTKQGSTTPDDSRAFATPSTRRLARELEIPVNKIDGTGIGNRITDSDVRAAAGEINGLEARSNNVTNYVDETQRDRSDSEALGVTVEEERKLSPIRQTIADRMTQSVRQAPHVTNKRKVTVERALEAADDLTTELDAPIGFTDILIAAVTRSLEKHPEFNAWYEGGRLRLVSEHNVAIAVDTDSGLMTPVIRETGTRPLEAIAAERRRLTDAVLEGDYTMAELQGGTFTITNLGMFGVDSFDPIINPPQIAILGVGRIRNDHGERQCTLSLSFDHRAVDGADAARFLETITNGLESPTVLAIDRARANLKGQSGSSITPTSENRTPDAEKTVSTAVASDLQNQAQEIGAFYGWIVPEFEVQLDGDRPSITVKAPDSVSEATLKRLTYTACRDSMYAGMINCLHDPNITITKER